VRADYRQRIKDLRERLDRLDDADAAVRDARRESGFHLVALAGYTNAGKSTLLRRLADDLAVEENDHRHDDLRETAASRDRLFETLDTTTRRATVGDRRVLLTDTVGFVSDSRTDGCWQSKATLYSAAVGTEQVLAPDESVSSAFTVLTDGACPGSGTCTFENAITVSDGTDRRRSAFGRDFTEARRSRAAA